MQLETNPAGPWPLTTPGPGEVAATKEMRQKVLAVLRSLPEEYRLPLTLRYLAGADIQTIELEMGLTNGSLRGLLHRGLEDAASRVREDYAKIGSSFHAPREIRYFTPKGLNPKAQGRVTHLGKSRTRRGYPEGVR